MFFVLSKVLGFLTNPLIFVFGFLIASVWVKKAPLKKRFFWIACSLLLFFSNDFIANEDNLLPLMYTIFCTYLFFGFRKFFAMRWYYTLLVALIFPIAFFVVDQALYRFLLFEITFAML